MILNRCIYKPIASSGWPEYELIDSGNQQKLERFGSKTLNRFEPDATWEPALGDKSWNTAFNQYISNQSNKTGYWKDKDKTQVIWNIDLDNLTFVLKLSKSQHIGIFPEQVENWRWLHNIVKNTKQPIHILNLFAYTGVASLYCSHSGGTVTHVDASKTAIELGKKSQSLSGLEQEPIRWIFDDVIKFVDREIRRGNKYEGILLDPPLFGRGPKGEIWKFEDAIDELLKKLNHLFSGRKSFFLITAYNIPIKEMILAKKAEKYFIKFNGTIEYGPLIQIEKSAGRHLKQSVYVRGYKNEYE